MNLSGCSVKFRSGTGISRRVSWHHHHHHQHQRERCYSQAILILADMTTTLTPIPPPFYSPYLDDQCNKISSKSVPWEVRRIRHSSLALRNVSELVLTLQGYQRAKLLSADELSLLKALAKLVSFQVPSARPS